jgi:uncharacterized protein YwqG
MSGFFSRWFGGTGQPRDDGRPARDVAALAAPLAVPAVHVVAADAPSRSHFGGSPNLPPDIAWPRRDGKVLTFLARLSLPELQQAHRIDWLSDAGALLFFYDVDNQPWGFDPKDSGGWAVLSVPDLSTPLTRHDAAVPSGPALPLRTLAFRRIDVLPSFERDSVRRLELSDKESDRYDELSQAVFRVAPKHQVGGYPAPVQGDEMEIESQLASHGVYCGDTNYPSDPRTAALVPGAAGWRLLFQMDSDDDLDVMWGDAGTIYFWVDGEAASKGRFENTWLILQCC